MTKYIFVTGGVVSGLGKGITAASLGRLLKCRGLKVCAQKLDPYMNVDPGTMNPLQHGEVFVTDDGAETDLDLGHYERFIDENLNKYSNLTSGKVYRGVLDKERNGEYLGQTVQIIPHVTNEIKDFIRRGAQTSKADVIITEIGGTIGDMESQPFIEAARQLIAEEGDGNCVSIHVCLVPYISGSEEYKSKPTQHSVRELQSYGISPDIIVARSDTELDKGLTDKIAMFCNVKNDCVINNITLPELYECPLYLHEQGLDAVVCRELGLSTPDPDLSEWKILTDKIRAPRKKVTVALVGKYVKLHDAYLSVAEALRHAGYAEGLNPSIEWVDCEKIDDESARRLLGGADGILVPGGFGDRGTDGIIAACRFARENFVPYFGICLGMQMMTIEFARNVAGIKDATSREFKSRGSFVIDLMPDQRGKKLGGTMRLGAYPCTIAEGTQMSKAYGKEFISERHRHRYEFNNDYKKALTDAGLIVSGTSPDGVITETVEENTGTFFAGVQFHPEFKSRPNRAHPLFSAFLKSAYDTREKKRVLSKKETV